MPKPIRMLRFTVCCWAEDEEPVREAFHEFIAHYDGETIWREATESKPVPMEIEKEVREGLGE